MEKLKWLLEIVHGLRFEIFKHWTFVAENGEVQQRWFGRECRDDFPNDQKSSQGDEEQDDTIAFRILFISKWSGDAYCNQSCQFGVKENFGGA